MHMRLLFLVYTFAICCVSPTLGAECPKGALFESGSTGAKILVTHIGIGQSRFAQGGTLQAGIALEILSKEGERGAIFGPMRSYMFVTDPDYLEKEGYQWQPVEEDKDGFYRVLSDDGKSELFTMVFLKCAE
jgi:hypothetical protein